MDDSNAIEVTPTGSVKFTRLASVFFREYPKRTIVGLTMMITQPFRVVAHTLFRRYPTRTLVAFAMMITQSFLYNAIFFTYALALQNFFDVDKSQTGYYFFPFAIGNLIGPLVLGPIFDTWGRRKMVLLTYGGSGVILAVSAALFQADVLNATTQTILWCAAFFLASAGASSAYLTVSEIFPLEVRSQAISYFFAIAQLAGAVGPALFGALIGDGHSRGPITGGYFLAAGIMIVGGLVTFFLGVDAERKPLEAITQPLSMVGRAETKEKWRDSSGDSGRSKSDTPTQR